MNTDMPHMVPIIAGHACIGFLLSTVGGVAAYDRSEQSLGIFARPKQPTPNGWHSSGPSITCRPRSLGQAQLKARIGYGGYRDRGLHMHTHAHPLGGCAVRADSGALERACTHRTMCSVCRMCATSKGRPRVPSVPDAEPPKAPGSPRVANRATSKMLARPRASDYSTRGASEQG